MRSYITGIAVLSLVAISAANAAEWYENTKVSGDMRVRYERIDEEGKDVRNRARIRTRIGAYSKANDEVDVGIRLATGSSSDPVSRNQTLTGGFGPKNVLLDLAYVDWHPEAIGGLNLIGGKMRNPFIVVNDYIWDGDITPEGAALKYKVGDDDIQMLVNGGAFWIEERSSDDEAMLYGAQAAVSMKPAESMTIKGGVSYFRFTNLEGYPVIDASGSKKSFGNSNETVGEESDEKVLYVTEYAIIEPFVEVGFDVGLPVTVFGSYANNHEADKDNTGFSAGIKLGKASKVNSFELAYDYRKLEKDAWLGALADSDSWGGGTDGKGHRVSFKYQILKNWQAGVTYFMNKKGLEKETDYQRLQVDLAARF